MSVPAFATAVHKHPGRFISIDFPSREPPEDPEYAGTTVQIDSPKIGFDFQL
jgi:hypothetical protein